MFIRKGVMDLLSYWGKKNSQNSYQFITILNKAVINLKFHSRACVFLIENLNFNSQYKKFGIQFSYS